MKTLLDAINEAEQIMTHSQRPEIENINRAGVEQARENLRDCITVLHRTAKRFPTGNSAAYLSNREFRAELLAQGREMSQEIYHDFELAIGALRTIENYKPILSA